MKVLEYPFDGEHLLKKKRSIKRELLADTEKKYIDKKIAILCGSTANEIKDMLELFLLNSGIRPEFYMSEYNKYWEDVMFDEPELKEFAPDLIYIHTTSRNITDWPTVRDSREDVDDMLRATYGRFEQMWDKAADAYSCPVIQNNFEQPFYRLMGNRDASDIHGRLNFVSRLNAMMYEYAESHRNFYVHDINYIASCYGIQEWANPFYWYMYKYAMDLKAVPEFAYDLHNMIKSIYGKNKKAFVLDLDNTLWGGVIGDDGADGIEIGHETAKAEMFTEFQQYLKAHKDLGIMLNIDSKNYEEVALEGLNRPDSTLKPEDFLVIKANWDPKDINLKQIAEEINIGQDSLVFVDDNPAERHIIESQVSGVAVPELEGPDTYIKILDRSGFFEVTEFSDDDLKRNSMYKANVERAKQQASFADYGEYLKSLEMKAEIRPFDDMYMSRITQLTNKTNQFNLTTRRCTQAEIESIVADDNYITLYGKLEDRFGDNGVVTVVFGHIGSEDEDAGQSLFHIDLWLMSCRVLKRDMEKAMLDALVRKCRERGIDEIIGYYYPTAKNKMVKEFYGEMGFEKVSEDEEENSVWKMDITDNYEEQNKYITIEEE
jgi:FkbH-like protein